MSPATLLQRFGSKRGLLLALAAATVDGIESTFSRMRAEYASPVAALIASTSALAQSSEAADEQVSGLSFLQADLQDVDFRRHAAEAARRVCDGYRALIQEAVSEGELSDCDVNALARALESIASGAFISWAVNRDGDASTFIERDVVTLLRGYGRGVWARR